MRRRGALGVRPCVHECVCVPKFMRKGGRDLKPPQVTQEKGGARDNTHIKARQITNGNGMSSKERTGLSGLMVCKIANKKQARFENMHKRWNERVKLRVSVSVSVSVWMIGWMGKTNSIRTKEDEGEHRGRGGKNIWGSDAECPQGRKLEQGSIFKTTPVRRWRPSAQTRPRSLHGSAHS